MSTKQYQQYPGYYGLETYPYTYMGGNQGQQGQPQQGQQGQLQQLQQQQQQLQQPQQMQQQPQQPLGGQQMQNLAGQYNLQSYNQYYMMNNQQVPQGQQQQLQQQQGQQPGQQSQQQNGQQSLYLQYQQPQMPQQGQQGQQANSGGLNGGNGAVDYSQLYTAYGLNVGQNSYALFPMYQNVPGGPQLSTAAGTGANSNIPQSQLYDSASNQRHDYRAASGANPNNSGSGSTLLNASQQQQNAMAVSNPTPPSSQVANATSATGRPQSSVSNTTSASGAGARTAGTAPSDASAAEAKRGDDLETPPSNSTLGQLQPPGIRPRVTTTMWEDEKTLCYQVDANNVSVVRRADNNMINGTKLLNVAQMTRGRRDGILKSEKMRHVVKIGSMHLKGVWIPFERALAMAQREGIVDMLYPLFVRDIKRMIQTGVTPAAHPTNATNTAVSAAGAGKAVPIATGGNYPGASTNTSGPSANGSYYPQQYSSQYPPVGAGGSNNGISATSGTESSGAPLAQHQLQQQLQQPPQQGQQAQQLQQQQGQQQGPSQLYGFSQQPYYNQYYQYNQGAVANGSGLGAGNTSYSLYSQEPFSSYPGYQNAPGASVAGAPGQKSSFDHGIANKGLSKQQGSPGQKDKDSDKKAKA